MDSTTDSNSGPKGSDLPSAENSENKCALSVGLESKMRDRVKDESSSEERAASSERAATTIIEYAAVHNAQISSQAREPMKAPKTAGN